MRTPDKPARLPCQRAPCVFEQQPARSNHELLCTARGKANYSVPGSPMDANSTAESESFAGIRPGEVWKPAEAKTDQFRFRTRSRPGYRPVLHRTIPLSSQ